MGGWISDLVAGKLADWIGGQLGDQRQIMLPAFVTRFLRQLQGLQKSFDDLLDGWAAL